jgi:DNA-binding transcriptional regulator GbsR (MarR family)
MAHKPTPIRPPEFAGLDEALAAELPSFEQFFKTFGFKRVHGRVWGLLVLAGQPLSSREIGDALSLSQGATSTCLSELTEWGAIQSEFDAARRCHLHAPVGNTLSIVATVFRRREQVVIGRFKHSVRSMQGYVSERYGEKDPRVLTLRSILSSLEIADAVLQLVFSSVERALGDSESLLSRAVRTALKVGLPKSLKRGPERDAAMREAAIDAAARELALPSGELADDEADEPAEEDEVA